MRRGVRSGAVLLLGLAGLGFVAGPALAEETREDSIEVSVAPTAEAVVGLYSKYVWRGFELSKDSLVIQPSLTVGYQGFSANFWSNIDTDWNEKLNPGVSDDDFALNETDFTLAYGRTIGMAEISAGYIYYDLEGLNDSQEVFLSASLDLPLNPTLTVYREIAHAPGWYTTLEVSHSIPLKNEIALDLGAKVSYWSFDHADDGPDPDDPADAFSNFHDGLLSAAITVPVNKYITVAPELYYSFPLSSDAADRIKAASVSGSDDNFVYGGVSVSLSF